MSDVKSKAWNWEIVNGDKSKMWLEPSIDSYYLVDRWKRQNKSKFLDLGCGLRKTYYTICKRRI